MARIGLLVIGLVLSVTPCAEHGYDANVCIAGEVHEFLGVESDVMSGDLYQITFDSEGYYDDLGLYMGYIW